MLLGEHLGRKVDHGNRLWLLYNAEVWYRMTIEGLELSEEPTGMDAGALVG